MNIYDQIIELDKIYFRRFDIEDMLKAKKYYALALVKMKRFKEGRDIYESFVEMFKKKYGGRDRETIEVMHNYELCMKECKDA